MLRDFGADTEDSRTFLTDKAQRQYLHSLMICEMLASVHIGIRANPHLRFIGWPEILCRAPDATRTSSAPFRIPVPSGGYLVPDGLFGIEYAHAVKKAYRFFALEADRGTMPVARSTRGQSSYLSKIVGYQDIIRHGVFKKHLGIPNLLVLTVTTNPRRTKEIMRRFEEYCGEREAFLFKNTDASNSKVPATQWLVEPWQRAGLPPLRIDT